MKHYKNISLYLIGLSQLSACCLLAQDISVTSDDVMITRGDTASLSCEASGGCPPYTYEWTSWSKGNSLAKKTDESISVKILDTCTVTVTVTDSAQPPATSSANVTITVNSRDWNTAHTTASDAWSDWGTWPFFGNPMGLNINANNGATRPLVGSTAGNWDSEVTRTKVSDANGPFDGYWYNSTHNLRVERETKINQYLKGQVSGACFNWVTLQNNLNTVTAAYVLDGTLAHENQGNVAANFNASPHQGGHSALMKAKQDSSSSFNAAKQVESAYENSEASLKSTNNSRVQGSDDAMFSATTDPLTGNWSGTIVADYDCATQNVITANVNF